MHIGGVFGRWELLITGEALRQASLAEAQARPGDVAIAAEAWPLVAGGCTAQPMPSGAMRLDALLDYLPMRELEAPALEASMADALRSYLPKAILARMDAGQTAWIAEQRRVTVLFINLPDLRSDTPLRQAQALMRTIQSMLYRFEGSISRLGIDNKGPTLVAALGLPPLAHEDDPERGLQAALAIQAALDEMGFASAIGVTTGQALCGAVGGNARREYTMMGSIVNRSARLMQAAAASAARDGGAALLCDTATYQAARARLRFEALAPLSLKGVLEPVPVFRPLVATAPVSQPTATVGTLIGREQEQRQIAAALARLGGLGRGGALLIEGDAGIGKTRLIEELRAAARQAGVPIYAGAGTPLESMPYMAWRTIFAALIAPEAEPGAGQAADDEDTAPLLRAVLNLDLPDTLISAQLSGQVRADNIRDLLLGRLAQAAERAPLVITLEDAQWLDPSSWALALAAAERVGPLLLVISARPMADPPPEYQRLAYLPGTTRLALRGLSPAQVRDLLAQRLGVAELPAEIWQLIAARSQGNPFFSEELLYTLRDSGLLVCADGICRVVSAAGDTAQALNGVRLPSTVQGLITSRIDRLSAPQQLTLKVASVIGQIFSLMTLSAVHPVERDPTRLVEQLFTLQQAGLVLIESFEPELVYAFKHAVVAEVAYNLMSFGQRRRLHRALAERYVNGDLPGPPAPPAQLAHHWREADDLPQAMVYLAQAGEQALRAGANREASGFLREAIQIAEGLGAAAEVPAALDLARWERQLGEAYHGIGRLSDSRELLDRAAARLGFPAPERPGTILLALARELLRQAARFLPGRRHAIAADTTALREAAHTYALLAQLAYYNSQLPAAIYAAVRSLNLAERAGASPELAGAYATAQLAAGALPPLAAIYRRKARATAERLDHLPTFGWVAEAQGLSYIGAGNWRRAAGALGVALAIAERLGDQRRRAECRAILCLAALYQADFPAALARLGEIAAAGQASGDAQVRTWGLIGQAECLLNMGDAERAAELLDEAAGLLAENVGSTRAEEIWAYALRARAALRCGEHSLALALASAASQLIGGTPPAAIYALGGYAALAEVYQELWDRGGAGGPTPRRELATGAQRAGALLGRFALIFPIARPATLIWQGCDAWRCGRQQLARRRWARAGALAGRAGMPYEQARALLQLGSHSSGAERRQHLAAAAAIFARLGATYDLGLARALLGAG
jgi:hypothetical protein